jgi:hypothetical protein
MVRFSGYFCSYIYLGQPYIIFFLLLLLLTYCEISRKKNVSSLKSLNYLNAINKSLLIFHIYILVQTCMIHQVYILSCSLNLNLLFQNENHMEENEREEKEKVKNYNNNI